MPVRSNKRYLTSNTRSTCILLKPAGLCDIPAINEVQLHNIAVLYIKHVILVKKALVFIMIQRSSITAFLLNRLNVEFDRLSSWRAEWSGQLISQARQPLLCCQHWKAIFMVKRPTRWCLACNLGLEVPVCPSISISCGLSRYYRLYIWQPYRLLNQQIGGRISW